MNAIDPRREEKMKDLEHRFRSDRFINQCYDDISKLSTFLPIKGIIADGKFSFLVDNDHPVQQQINRIEGDIKKYISVKYPELCQSEHSSYNQ